MGRSATAGRKLAKKRAIDVSGHKKFWPMQERGAELSKDGRIVNTTKKVFRCMCCGSTTKCKGDYGGEPDVSKCTPDCQAHTKNSRASTVVTDQFRENYSETFGHE